MKKGWATLLFFVCSFGLYAQKEGNIWYFGKNAGIDFNVNPPVALIDGALSTNEGCASICDSSGRILVYTDGITVYNKAHQVMVNGSGLLGHSSSTQSAVIVPWPEHDSLYYIITADAYDNVGVNGYNFSIVNINKHGRQGEVVIKNQLLYSPSTEKLTIAKHSNDLDWWVITKQLGNDQFNIYLIDQAGIHTTPVISKIASVTTANNQAFGCMRVSPDNKKLAVAYSYTSFFELYDFDNEKGLLSNPIKVSSQLPYGVAFSPDSKMLYVSNVVSSNGKICQYDISKATDSVSLEASRIVITPATFTHTPLGMQLGPDDKIYVNYSNAIAVIQEPNTMGIACRLEENAIDLKGRKPGVMFPATIIQKYQPPIPFIIDAQITITDPCKREVAFEAISNQLTNITYKWSFGFGATSTIQKPIIVFPHVANAFQITLEVAADILTGSGQKRQTRTFSKQIQFEPLPEANAGNDIAVMKGTPFQLEGSGGITYDWSPAQYLNDPIIARPTAMLQADQTFTLKVSNTDGCTDEDQVFVKVYKSADLYVPTAFTPNGDSKNDLLHIVAVGAKAEVFTIYNRWGNLVFSTTDPAKGWNGWYQGKPQPAGTYVWIAKGTDFNGKKISKKGTVNLMR